MNTDDKEPTPLLALLFDLGDTLEHDCQTLPGVPEALAAIAALSTPGGAPLRLGLVSDFTMPSSPDGIAPLFAEYVEVVRRLGLLPWFSPPEERVTLSTQAGVRKPDARIFQLALQRLGLGPDLRTTAFITEDAAHVSACLALGMRALRFGPGGDFDDWRRAPQLVARLLNPHVDADQFLKTLEDNKAVGPASDPLAPGVTHTVETALDGEVVLKHRRVSAF